MDYLISDATAKKLAKKHAVQEHEIIECFHNRVKRTLIDDRDKHKTNPPTEWFIAETDMGRKLKVVFIQISESECVIRTAYPPNQLEDEIYERNI